MSDVKSIAQLLSEEGKFVGTTSGVSMEPLFSDRRDTIIVLKNTIFVDISDFFEFHK